MTWINMDMKRRRKRNNTKGNIEGIENGKLSDLKIRGNNLVGRCVTVAGMKLFKKY